MGRVQSGNMPSMEEVMANPSLDSCESILCPLTIPCIFTIRTLVRNNLVWVRVRVSDITYVQDITIRRAK